ncbi:uncharacterized protein [Henckelia pumila]|uniref:uncharacterized protein n=1 Tax=Henckelia pumila TaxID=405737 RepID=UPI003C6E8F5E
MSCIIWNVRGLENQRAIRELKRLIAKKKKPSVLSLQNKIEIALSFIKHSEKHWRFTGFYGNPEPGSRNISWELFRRLHGNHELRELPWLVGGDFNEICYDREKFGGNMRPMHQTKEFRDVLKDYSLQDLHGSGEFYKWVNQRANDELIFERLDRFVATFSWRILYPAARAQSFECYHFDHRAILLDLGNARVHQFHNGPRFRFETHWATEADISDTIARGWCKEYGSLTLTHRIQNCKDALSAWAGNRFRNFSNQIQKMRARLNRLKKSVNWSNSVAQIQTLENHIETLASKEEFYWKQRSRVNWLAHGDQNSKFFSRKCIDQKS